MCACVFLQSNDHEYVYPNLQRTLSSKVVDKFAGIYLAS